MGMGYASAEECPSRGRAENENRTRGSGKAHTFAKNANVWGTRRDYLGHPANFDSLEARRSPKSRITVIANKNPTTHANSL
jgi:hypothetical protein